MQHDPIAFHVNLGNFSLQCSNVIKPDEDLYLKIDFDGLSEYELQSSKYPWQWVKEKDQMTILYTTEFGRALNIKHLKIACMKKQSNLLLTDLMIASTSIDLLTLACGPKHHMIQMELNQSFEDSCCRIKGSVQYNKNKSGRLISLNKTNVNVDDENDDDTDDNNENQQFFIRFDCHMDEIVQKLKIQLTNINFSLVCEQIYANSVKQTQKLSSINIHIGYMDPSRASPLWSKDCFTWQVKQNALVVVDKIVLESKDVLTSKFIQSVIVIEICDSDTNKKIGCTIIPIIGTYTSRILCEDKQFFTPNSNFVVCPTFGHKRPFLFIGEQNNFLVDVKMECAIQGPRYCNMYELNNESLCWKSNQQHKIHLYNAKSIMGFPVPSLLQKTENYSNCTTINPLDKLLRDFYIPTYLQYYHSNSSYYECYIPSEFYECPITTEELTTTLVYSYTIDTGTNIVNSIRNNDNNKTITAISSSSSSSSCLNSLYNLYIKSELKEKYYKQIKVLLADFCHARSQFFESFDSYLEATKNINVHDNDNFLLIRNQLYIDWKNKQIEQLYKLELKKNQLLAVYKSTFAELKIKPNKEIQN